MNLFSKIGDLLKGTTPTVVHKVVKPTTVVKKTVVKQTVEKKTVEKKAEKKTVTAPVVSKTDTVTIDSANKPILRIGIDPGHDKTTGGKKSPYSLGKLATPVLPFEEWKFNREIATALSKALNELGIETFITTDEQRDPGVDVKLTTRATRSNNFLKDAQHGMFISIHADAHGNGDEWTKARGWSVFTTKGLTISDTFAECLYDAAEKIFKPKGLTLRTNKSDGDRDWEENFTVIYKSEQLSIKSGKVTVPAVLIENFFYTNVDDVKYISSKEGHEDIVNVIVEGVLSFIKKQWGIILS